MQRPLIIVALLASTCTQALASSHYEMTYHDMIQPNGHARSDATYNSALDTCYNQTREAREAKDTAAFKACMRQQGYRWVSTRLVRDTETSPLQPGDAFIDPDTGLSCRNVGGASICVPPRGTVRYRNSEGLNCTRTGIAEFCSSF